MDSSADPNDTGVGNYDGLPEADCRTPENDTAGNKRTAHGSKRKDNPGENAPSTKDKKQVSVRSFVWEHYTRIEGNGDKCKCNYCGRVMSCPTSSGTSNLQKHLLSCKQYKVYQEDQVQQKLNRDGVDGNLKFGRVSIDVFREAANEMVVIGELPLSFVEGLAFKHFCNKCKLYKPHSRRTATRDMVEMYIKKKEEMMRLIGDQRVSLTTDIWVAPTTGNSYMVITAHFIDANWRLKKLIIGFKNVTDHKGRTISRVLLECLAEWGIKKIFTITVDNATANSSALKKFKEEFKDMGQNSLVLGGEFMHMRCAAHIINLVVRDGLQEVDSSVSAIRNGVSYVRSSGTRVKSFELRVDSGKMTRGSLPLDVKTRWNSTYLMLTRALKFRLAFDKMEAEDKLYNDHFQERVQGVKREGPPSKVDWEVVGHLVKFLRIFYNSTLVVSASTSVNSHKCYAEICTIERNLTSLSEDLDEELSHKAITMLEKFDKYWEGLKEINRMLIVASVFDPRNKMHFATLCFEKLYGKNSAASKELHHSVTQVLKSLFEEYNLVYGKSGTNTGVSQSQTTSSFSGQEQVATEKMDLEDDIGYERMDFMYKEMIDEIGLQDASNELELYLNEKVENPKNSLIGTEYDILSWWKVNAPKYPILFEIARDVLAMQVSSVASESAFSTSGRVLDPSRSCLTHYMIEVLMCTEQWLKCTIQLNDKGAIITNQQLLADIELQDSLEREFQN